LANQVILDHVAIGLPRVGDARPFLEGALGGIEAGGHPGVPFGFLQWKFAGGGRIEVIYPMGPPDGFVHRFLARGGPRVHHVTFKVPSLDAICARAEKLGYTIVGSDRTDPYWQEAFLHPKEAQGIVVQMVESRPRPDGESFPDPPAPTSGARVLGPRLSAKSAAAARKQWGELLEGAVQVESASLTFRWPDSPLAISVELDPARDEGPLAIELAAPHALALPKGPVPELGTRFVQVS
jgi:methylmalonyl-CoA/ethylmalonyl-CoA epimerase